MSAAAMAVYAAKNCRKWGAWAAVRYVEKNAAPMGIYLAALSFECRRKS